ncbi:hypothetical protein GF407_04710 [candidate division KSB1 bacterium]|nr:hypothetical protein [candidate division KSB1 bacterium]
MFTNRLTETVKTSRAAIFRLVLMLLFLIVAQGYSSPVALLDSARTLFYKSVEKKEYVDDAMYIFNRLITYEEYKGVARTYLGALTALEGKYAFMPTTKYNKALKGLKMMDEGVESSPENIEARFIRGTTSFYMPFFFNRKETAEEDFQAMIAMLESNYQQYDLEIVQNVIQFLKENTELTPRENAIVERVGEELKEKRLSG